MNTHTNRKAPEALRREVAHSLQRVLADSYVLYAKTQGFHWNVTGPLFGTLHDMFERQYTELAAAIDTIAERVRALGHRVPGSLAQFGKLTVVPEEQEVPSSSEMVRQLAEGHRIVAARLRETHAVAEDADDISSADLASERMQAHEHQAWMLESLLDVRPAVA